MTKFKKAIKDYKIANSTEILSPLVDLFVAFAAKTDNARRPENRETTSQAIDVILELTPEENRYKVFKGLVIEVENHRNWEWITPIFPLYQLLKEKAVAHFGGKAPTLLKVFVPLFRQFAEEYATTMQEIEFLDPRIATKIKGRVPISRAASTCNRTLMAL